MTLAQLREGITRGESYCLNYVLGITKDAGRVCIARDDLERLAVSEDKLDKALIEYPYSKGVHCIYMNRADAIKMLKEICSW